MAKAEGGDELQILLVSTNGLMNFNGSPTVFIAVRHYVASTVQPCTSSYTRTVPCHARAVGLGENTLAILSSPEAYENTLPLIPTVEGVKSSLLAALLQLTAAWWRVHVCL